MPPSSMPAPATSNDSALDRLAAEYWEGRMQADPIEATLLGDRRLDDRMPDQTPRGTPATSSAWKTCWAGSTPCRRRPGATG